MVLKVNLQIGITTDYLAHLFEKDKESGAYMVSTTNDVGRLIIAYAMRSDRPKIREPKDDEVAVAFELPRCESTQHLDNSWLYIQQGDIARLQGAIKSYFDIDLVSYYQSARAMGFQKKEAIEMFCVSRKLLRVDPYEAIHKRLYRAEIDKLGQLVRMLYNKVYHFERTLNKSI